MKSMSRQSEEEVIMFHDGEKILSQPIIFREPSFNPDTNNTNNTNNNNTNIDNEDEDDLSEHDEDNTSSEDSDVDISDYFQNSDGSDELMNHNNGQPLINDITADDIDVLMKMIQYSFSPSISSNDHLISALKESYVKFSEFYLVNQNTVDNVKMKTLLLLASKVYGYNIEKINRVKEERLCFEAMAVLLFSRRKYMMQSDDLVISENEFYSMYPDCQPNLVGKDESNALYKFRNLMKISMVLIPPLHNKNHLLDLITRMVEGHAVRHVTGTGATKATRLRVNIILKEGNLIVPKRPPRLTSHITSSSKLKKSNTITKARKNKKLASSHNVAPVVEQKRYRGRPRKDSLSSDESISIVQPTKRQRLDNNSNNNHTSVQYPAAVSPFSIDGMRHNNSNNSLANTVSSNNSKNNNTNNSTGRYSLTNSLGSTASQQQHHPPHNKNHMMKPMSTRLNGGHYSLVDTSSSNVIVNQEKTSIASIFEQYQHEQNQSSSFIPSTTSLFDAPMIGTDYCADLPLSSIDLARSQSLEWWSNTDGITTNEEASSFKPELLRETSFFGLENDTASSSNLVLSSNPSYGSNLTVE